MGEPMNNYGNDVDKINGSAGAESLSGYMLDSIEKVRYNVWAGISALTIAASFAVAGVVIGIKEGEIKVDFLNDNALVRNYKEYRSTIAQYEKLKSDYPYLASGNSAIEDAADFYIGLSLYDLNDNVPNQVWFDGSLTSRHNRYYTDTNKGYFERIMTKGVVPTGEESTEGVIPTGEEATEGVIPTIVSSSTSFASSDLVMR